MTNFLSKLGLAILYFTLLFFKTFPKKVIFGKDARFIQNNTQIRPKHSRKWYINSLWFYA